MKLQTNYHNSAALTPLAMSESKTNAAPGFVITRGIEKSRLFILLALLHIPLGILLKNLSFLAVLHPLAVLAIGLYFALRKRAKLEQAAAVVMYLIGSEVLWRMVKSPVFWEYGKYASILILVVALVRKGYWKIPVFPLLYFLCLLPATFVTFASNNLAEAHNKVSFNMSGPLLLLVSCWFFLHLKVNAAQLKKVFAPVLLPLLSIAVYTLFNTVTTPEIKFGTESNFATSGSFGPNQVSSVLGLGVFVCLTLFVLFKNSFKETAFLSAVAILLAAQSVLTFSRGGMYNAIGAFVFVLLFQFRNLNQGIKKLLPILAVVVIFLVLIFPFLNDFTGGALENRFKDTNTTGRLDIIDADYHIFMQNPVFGAGVGEAYALRAKYYGKEVGAHTEFARVLSEHGIFGIFSIIFLLVTAVYNLRRHKSNTGKAFAVGLFVWSNLFMFNAGMRLAAPGLLIGMGFLTLLPPVRLSGKHLAKILNRKTKPLIS